MLKDIENRQKTGKYYLIVTPFFPSEKSFRGPYIYDQVKAIMRNSEYQVIVFVSASYSEKSSFYDYDGIRVYLFQTMNTRSYFFNGIFNNYNAKSFLSTFKKIGIPGEKVAYIHCHTSTFGAIGVAFKNKFPKTKILLQHHCRDPYTILNGKFSSWYPNLYYRAITNIHLFKKIDVHVSISKIVDENLKRFPDKAINEDYEPYIRQINKLHVPPVHINKSIILYNGVDTDKFYVQASNQVHNLFRIGCIANFSELKNQITLIKAARMLIRQYNFTNLRIVFIGSGPELQNCKKYVALNGLSEYIEFLSEVDHSLLCNFYNTLDLFVLPSVFEGFGCVFTEAYACGVPFMLCENQGASEYILSPDYDKWIFRKYDYKQLADRIMAYVKYRFKQKLRYPYDIDILIKDFLKKIESDYEQL